jgi:hypothetical protein
VGRRSDTALPKREQKRRKKKKKRLKEFWSVSVNKVITAGRPCVGHARASDKSGVNSRRSDE